MTEFKKRVYAIVKKIPRGQVLTYQQVAVKLGCAGLARAVGNALNKNLNPQVSCHRVVKSDGSLGGYRSGIKKKIKILRDEDAKIKNGKIVNF